MPAMRPWFAGMAALALAGSAFAAPVVAVSGNAPTPAVDVDALPAAAASVGPARLAVATEIAAVMMPPGSLVAVMSGATAQLSGGIRNNMLNAPMLAFIRAAGIRPDKQVRIDEATETAAMATIDPAFGQRQLIISETLVKRAATIVEAHEPVARAALATAHARRMTREDLTALRDFLRKPAGLAYAEAMRFIPRDPANIASSRELFGKIDAALPAVTSEIAKATGALPRPRRYADLTETEKSRVFKLIGATPADTPPPVASATAPLPAEGSRS